MNKFFKRLALLLAVLMIVSMMPVQLFADNSVAGEEQSNGTGEASGNSNAVAKIGDTGYESLADAIANATPDANGTIIYEIYGKATVDSTGWVQVARAGLTGLTKVEFVGKTSDAEICIVENAGLLADQSYDIDVSFANLILSKKAPGWVGDMGHAANYFTCWLRNTNAAENTVTYTNCTFPNGLCNNQYGKTVVDGCTFSNTTTGMYNFWNYGGNTEIKNSTFTGVRGIKTYNEGTLAVAPTVKIENTTFDSLTEKAAIVASKATDITLDNVSATDCGKGFFQKDIESSGETTTIEANGSDISGNFNITAEKGAAAAKEEFNISAGTFTSEVSSDYLADDFELKDNGDGTYGVAAKNYVAAIGDAYYSTLQEAIDAARRNSTVKLLADTRENVTIDKQLTLDLNGFTLNGSTGERKPALTVTVRGVTVKDSSEAQTGTIMRDDTPENSGVSSHYVIDIQGNGWLTFESGIVKNNSGSAAGKGASLVRVGDDSVAKQPGLVINGGSFTQDNFIVIKVDRGYLTLNGGTLTSANSYAIENWFRATIKGGTVNGTAAAWTYSGGFNSTLTVEGGTINGNVLSVNYGSAEGKVAKVEITGGTVNGELGTYTYSNGLTATEDATKATIGITGGTFSSDPTKYLVEGSTVTPNSDGTFGVEKLTKAYLAEVDGNKYYTMDEAFHAAVAAGSTLKLLRNYTTASSQNSGSKSFTIDLNGFTWTYTGTNVNDAAFEINHPNATLTVKNGKVVSASMAGLIPSAMSGTITYDNSGLVFDGVEITANGHSGIETNGNNTNDTVTLKNSTLNVPNGFGIYFPSSGTLTVENSKITAKTMGVQVCAGSLSINEGSAVTVTGDAVEKTENDGAIQDGAAISIVNRTGYKGLGTVTISGGKFTAKEGNSAIKAYNWATNTESAFTASDKVAVSGGTFSSEVSEDLCAEGFIPTKNADDTYGVKAGKYVAQIGSTKYETLEEAVAAANDGDTVTLLADVTADVAINKNITLDLGGKTLTNTNSGKATITISAGTTATVKNGNVIGGASYYNIGVGTEVNSTANLTLEDVTATAGNTDSSMIDNWGTLTITSGTYTGGLNVVKSEEGSTLTINGGKFTLEYATSGYTGVIFAYGTTTITGGEFIQNLTTTGRWNHPQVILAGVEEGYPSSVTVTGGIFTNKMSDESIFRGVGKATSDNFEVSGGTFNKSVSESYCADGFIPTKNADGTYGVKEGKYVAAVGSTKYETLDAAFAALGSKNYTLKLLDETVWDAATPVYWQAGTQSGYVAKLTDALTAAYKAGAANIKIVCYPGADVGEMTHGHVADSLTIYGNKAYISGGECDLEVDTFKFSRTTGAQANDGAYLEKDITVAGYALDNLGVWGQRNTDYTVTVKLVDCDGKEIAGKPKVQRVYISGAKGTNNITLNKCDFITTVCPVYSNADGKVNVENCTFTGVAEPINLKHKGTGTATYSVKSCIFTNCGSVGSDKAWAAPIRFVSDTAAGTVTATVTSCTFTDTVGTNGDILLGDGRPGEPLNDVSLTVSKTAATVMAQKAGYYDANGNVADETKGKTLETVKTETVKTGIGQMFLVAKIGDVGYSTLAEAIAAAKDGETIKLLADCSGNGIQVPKDKFADKGLIVDFGGHTYTVGGVLVGSAGTGTNAFQLLQGNKITFMNGSIVGATENTKPAEDTPNWHGAPAIMIQNYCDLTLKNMTVTGGDETVYTMSNNHGDVVIEDSTINAGKAKGYTSAPIAFDACGYSSYDGVSVTVKGNSVINGDIEISRSIGNANDVKLTLESGTVNGTLKVDSSIKSGDATTITKSSTFELAAPEGYEWFANVGGTQSLSKAYAKIGETYYKSLAEALEAANAGDTITLLADINTPEKTYVVTKSLTIDLNGKTVTGSGYDGVFEVTGEYIEVVLNATNGGKVIAVENSGSAGKYAMAVWMCGAGSKLTINGGEFIQNITSTDDKQMDMIYASAGTIIINSGSFTSGTPKWTLNIKDSAYKDGTANIIVNGGTFTDYDPRNAENEGKGTSLVANGVGIDKNADGTFTAKSGMAAQIVDADGNSVAAYAGHYDAIAAAKDGETVILLSDRKNFVTNTINANITIDLNGKTLSVGNNNPFFRTNGEVTIQNGTIDSQYACVIVNAYNKLTLKNVKITGVTDGNGKNLVNVCSNAEVTIDKDTVLTASGSGVAVFIGQDADAKYTLNVYGKVIQKDKSFAICGNGSYKGTTTINIYDGAEVKSASVAIYHPQAGVINVNGGLVEGYCAIAMKSGTLNISGGTVRGTANDHVLDDSNSTSGGANYDGSAIIVDSRSTGYAGNVNINVTGGTVESYYSTAIREIGEQGKTDMTQLTKLNVIGGSVLGASKNPVNVTSDMLVRDISVINISVSGGTFKHAIPDSYCADRYIPTKNEDGTYGVKEGKYVAQIGNVKYETLEEAFAAAKNGDTITLLEDCKSDRINLEDKSVTVVLNGKTLTSTAAYGVMFCAKNGNKITIDGNVEGSKLVGTLMITAETDGHIEVNGGTYENSQYCPIYVNGAVNSENSTVTVKNAIINATNSNSNQDMGCAVYLAGYSTSVFENCTITAPVTGIEIRAGKLTLNNCDVTGGNREVTAEANGNGTTVTNAALAISQHTTKKPIEVIINGGTFNGTAAVYQTDVQGTGSADVKIAVKNGTFNGTISGETDGAIVISGGKFKVKVDDKYFDGDHACSTDKTGDYYTVTGHPITGIGISIGESLTLRITVDKSYKNGKLKYTYIGAKDGKVHSGIVYRAEKDKKGNWVFRISDINAQRADVIYTVQYVDESEKEVGSAKEVSILKYCEGLVEQYKNADEAVKNSVNTLVCKLLNYSAAAMDYRQETDGGDRYNNMTWGERATALRKRAVELCGTVTDYAFEVSHEIRDYGYDDNAVGANGEKKVGIEFSDKIRLFFNINYNENYTYTYNGLKCIPEEVSSASTTHRIYVTVAPFAYDSEHCIEISDADGFVYEIAYSLDNVLEIISEKNSGTAISNLAKATYEYCRALADFAKYFK